MKKRLRIRNHKFIWRVLASFFMVCVLSLHAPLQADAAVNTFALIKSNVVSGSHSYVGSSINLAYNTSSVPFSYAKSGDIGYDYYLEFDGSGFQHVSMEFPVSKTFLLSQSDTGATKYDFYFLGFNGTITPNISKRLNTNVSGDISIRNVVSYFVIDCGGQRKESLPGLLSFLRFDPYMGHHAALSIRIEFDISYYGHSHYQSGGSTNGNTFSIGSVTVTPSYTVIAADLYGSNFTSTGEQLINNSINNLSTWLNTMLNSIYTKIGAESSAIQLAINQNGQAIVSNMNANHASMYGLLQQQHQQEIDNDNRNADDIMHSYDKSSQDSDNACFESSRAELQEQEDSLFSSAMDGFGSLDMSDYSFGKFTAMLDAFSFVSGFMQSCFVKMGDFGVIVTIGLVVMIATKVIGLYRFSTGGDSS